ncbi:hypothetical protein P22_1838 [Propionispora sp. 2/2-37]|uniref:efflux RND transporter periplasmic adaptor subunit n=1 Tax=Propionispora sp. 2/2-37 TaxID=1677858 RepID=UPI0006BB5EAE|nr:efflux RND transporter periplasmic adaptor subunit [Propionispora sp. 2/2-37]CUH95758.1 hypothetical protein P22_1838 [Propionispora sp. 2/2-37]
MNTRLVRYTVLLTLSIFFISGCSGTTAVKEAIPLVRTQTIHFNQTDQQASYSGEVRGRYETQLSFQTGGKIIKRLVESGNTVKAGDILMEIDAKDIQQTVNSGSAQLASAQSQLTLARNNLERYTRLYEQGAISRAQLDQYQSSYDVALSAVQQASAQYNQGTNQLGYSTLTADSNGIISNITAEAGQVVSAGQSVLTLVKDGEREVEINIPENHVESLRHAGQVQVSFWALPGIVTNGEIREISPVADKVTRTYTVRIHLVSPPPNLQLGMTATVTAANVSAQPSVYIPLSAIYQTGDTPNVWVINEGQVTLHPVKVGSFGDGKIQVLDGLQDGDIIVCAGVQKLHEGQKVRYE